MRTRQKDIAEVLPPLWPRQISLVHSGDTLSIEGHGPRRALQSVLKKYARTSCITNQQELPHIQLANAKGDTALLDFVRTWGPITAACHTEGGSEGEAQCVKAKESLERARQIRDVLAAAIRVFALSRKRKLQSEETISGISCFVQALGALPKDSVEKTIWFDCAIVLRHIEPSSKKQAGNAMVNLREACRDVLCSLVNRYPERLVATKRGFVPMPSDGHGIFPFLMFLLRHDLVAKHRMFVCERCGRYFLHNREKTVAGCPKCRDAIRQKKYYWSNPEAARQRHRRARQHRRTTVKGAL